MRKISMLLMMMSYLLLVACGTPVGIQKCYTDYNYYQDGKVKQEYKECVSQTPEKMPAINPKHKDLLE
jgi:hypothetical protein